jgi:hypothetical protein
MIVWSNITRTIEVIDTSNENLYTVPLSLRLV